MTVGVWAVYWQAHLPAGWDIVSSRYDATHGWSVEVRGPSGAVHAYEAQSNTGVRRWMQQLA